MTIDHHLKITPEHFAAVADGSKRAELRVDDREPRYEAGHVVSLEWFDGLFYDGRVIVVRITHVLRDHELLKPGTCMFSFDVMEKHL